MRDIPIRGPESAVATASNKHLAMRPPFHSPVFLVFLAACALPMMFASPSHGQTGVVSFSQSSYSAVETDAAAVITVILTPSASATGTVDYVVTGGTAIPDVDYPGSNITGTATFPPGSTNATIQFSLLNDPSIDPDETVDLALTNATGPIEIGSLSNAVLNISALAASVSFSQAVYSVAESLTNVEITVVRLGNLGATGSVAFAAIAGTAKDGVDFTATNGTLTFASWQLSTNFIVRILGDPAVDENETVNLTLRNAAGDLSLGSPSDAVLNILDQHPPALEFSAPSYRVLRHAGHVTITVERLGDTSGAASVSYATSDGTATSGIDYFGTSGLMNFAPGVVSNSFSFVVVNPHVFESNQTVNLNLSGADLGPRSNAVVNIVNDQRQTVVLTDDDGELVTLTLQTAGAMVVATNGADVNIHLDQTDASSRLTVKVRKRKGGDGLVKIGTIQGDGGCGRIDAPNADLDGAGIILTNGSLGTLRVHDILNGAGISLPNGFLGTLRVHDILDGGEVLAGGTTNQTTKILAHDIPDGTIISVGGRLAMLHAARLSGGEIDAASIGAISIVGDRRNGIPAVIEGGTITISDPDTAVTNGTIARISAAQMIDSTVFAGFTPDDALNPMGGGEFVPDLTIGSVSLTARSNALVNSTIAAANIGSVNLRSVGVDNDSQPFGVLAGQHISSVTVRNPPFHWQRNGANDQSLGDFHVVH